VRCNQWIKFDMLLDRARGLGAEVLATGHYARVVETDGRYRLLRGVDPAKDQSYVLWMLSQDDLRHVRFPVGGQLKSETRAIAEELGLRTAHKPDSQEICFVRAGEVGTYVNERTGSGPGEIVDPEGRVVGHHEGLGNFTIGQRKGLGVALGEPVFVTGIDAGANRVTIGRREELAVAAVDIDEVSFIGEPVAAGTEVLVQYRSHGEAFPATVSSTGETWRITFGDPVEAVAPGQSAVLYSSDDQEVLGGGIIAAAVPATRLERAGA
jgi:tRNA-specific 2-thiouridylase